MSGHKKKIIVCFPNKGGVKQFSDKLYSFLEEEYKFHQCDTTNLITKFKSFKLFKYVFYSDIIFTSNNILLYPFILLTFGKVSLILHDHKLRVGAGFKEKLILFLFLCFRWRFNKVIIHADNDEFAIQLLKKPNVSFLKMPPHGFSIEKHHGTTELLPSKSINILCFGRIEKYKNFDFIASLVKDIDFINLTIAGSGTVSDALDKLSTQQDNIKIINKYISDDELSVLMKNSHFIALPYSDITQTGLIELAGFFHKPLITSDILAFSLDSLKSFTVKLSLSDSLHSKLILEDIRSLSDLEYKEMCSFSYNNYLAEEKRWPIYASYLRFNTD